MKQIYEKYWKITLAYTNIYAEEFEKVLNIIIHFIDDNYTIAYSDKKYKELQKSINDIFPKNEASIRKVINTYVKLGFINYRLESYHKDSPVFIKETNRQKKKTIFSKIVYSNSSFDRTVTNYSRRREINFLIKTLAEVKKIDKTDLLALMTKDITAVSRGYLNREELDQVKKYAEKIDFASRKYNQLGHLWAILRNLDNLVIKRDYLYLEEDATELGLDTYSIVQKRDPYLQIIYKNGLKEECMQLFGKIQCMVERLDYPPISLIASHIKPFIESSEDEAYDANNGLLLSRNIDILFDKGYISFEKNGKIILSNKLTKNVKKYLSNYYLDGQLLTEKRKSYLNYHRTKIFAA